MTKPKRIVVFAQTEPWEAFTWLAAALRKRGFASYRVTAPPRSRKQKLSSYAYGAAYNHTEMSLGWAGGTAPVDVSAVESVWGPNVVDLQATDRVGAALLDSPNWSGASQLHRVPDSSKELRLYDKLSQVQDAQAAGVQVPRTWTNPNDVLGDRVVIKQRLGSGGDAVVITDVTEIDKWTRKWEGQGGGLVFQEVVTGDVVIVGGFAKSGQIQEAVAYRSLPAPDDPQGPAVRIQTIDREDLISDTARYLAHMDYTGAFCLDFVVNSESYLIDVNPRFFGSWAAAQRAGLPILEAYLSYLRDQPFDQDAVSVPTQTLWTVPAACGALGATTRQSLRTLADLYPIIGNRGMLATAPSLARALRAAR